MTTVSKTILPATCATSLTDPIREAAVNLLQRCQQRAVRLVVAESCTGGLITAALTAIPGASRVVDRALVCYSNEAKQQELGVPKALIDQFGAVSEPVAAAMATGALQRAHGQAQLSLAVTGVAGPEATAEKPVGLVHLAVARHNTSAVQLAKHQFGPLDRDAVRQQTVLAALQFTLQCLEP
jgi:nicotinamide-nucleotide amidase